MAQCLFGNQKNIYKFCWGGDHFAQLCSQGLSLEVTAESLLSPSTSSAEAGRLRSAAQTTSRVMVTMP